MKFGLIAILILITYGTQAQQKGDLPIWLRSVYEQNRNEPVELIVYGDREFVEYLSEKGLPFREYTDRAIRAAFSRTQIEEALRLHHSLGIEPGLSQPRLLNDSMISNNRITRLHKGKNPFVVPTTGSGVIIGFIDSGIDFSHPDFQDSTGKTRVLKIWDQAATPTVPARIPAFGYGQVWDSSDINLGNCPHDDDVLSHGTNVAGIAAGNGNAINQYEGVAPDANIIMVASDFNSSNWLQTVADGVEYIFTEAQKLGQPCVVNISAGEYLGSHDGTDLAAVRIDSMIKAKDGRALVAAAGNSGNFNYHLGYQVGTDTNFTWFYYNANSSLGYGAVYFQLWADTAEFNNVQFAVGANTGTSNNFQFRGRTNFGDVSSRINTLVADSIFTGTHVLAYVETNATVLGDKYLLEVHLPQPDSNQYLFSFMTTGSGKFDVWSDNWLGTSHIYYAPLPTVSQFPFIQFYRKPDSLQTMVSSFTCLPSVISVGNYTNRNSYIDYSSITQTFQVAVGEKAVNSSLGPNRKGYQKPDVMASGDFTLTANRLASIPLHIANGQSDRIAQGGFHKRNGGTSMASPVVAGTVALMLEQCPGLSYSEIINDLVSHAYTDNFTTSNVPNYSYGYGKVDAFETVNSRRLDVDVDPSGEILLCAGDSLELSSDPGMSAYKWSTGDSLNPVFVSIAGQISLMVVNPSGCRGYSDTSVIIAVPNPAKPAIEKISGQELQSSEAHGHQWYLNGQQLPGEDKRTLFATSDGFYQVEVTDLNGCSSISDSLDFQVFIEEMNAYPYISLIPNPVGGQIRIESNTPVKSIRVLNIHGSIVLRSEIRNDLPLDVSMLEKGYYFAQISDVFGKEKMIPFIKQ